MPNELEILKSFESEEDSTCGVGVISPVDALSTSDLGVGVFIGLGVGVGVFVGFKVAVGFRVGIAVGLGVDVGAVYVFTGGEYPP